MARAVHGEREGSDAHAFRFVESLLGVVDRVFLFGAVATVAVVLRTAVAEEEEDLHLGVRELQLVRGVADRRAHPS